MTGLPATTPFVIRPVRTPRSVAHARARCQTFCRLYYINHLWNGGEIFVQSSQNRIDDRMAESHSGRREHVRYGRIHGRIVPLIPPEQLHASGPEHIGQPMRVRYVLQFCADDFTRFMKQNVPFPVRIDFTQLSGDTVVLADPYRVHGQQTDLKERKRLLNARGVCFPYPL